MVQDPGEDSRLAVGDVPDPIPGPGEVVVEVAACGLCHHDVAVMRGQLRRGVRPDVVLGHEISGRVVEAGDSVAAVHVGDPVVATLTAFCGECSRCTSGREYRCLKGRGVGHTLDGGLAQFVKLPESSVVPVPEGIDLYEASIAACPMGVALQAVRDVARARPGETVAVTGAGGGLGAHAFQLAAALGARALAVTASPAKEEPLRQLGVGEVIVAGELDFSEIVFALTEDQGVDVVIDTVGSTLLRSSLASLAQYGRLVLLGEIAGGTAPIRPAEIIFRDSAILGSTGAGRRHIRDVLDMVGSGSIKPLISQWFSLEDVPLAYALMRSKKTFGRVAVRPNK